MPTYEYRCEKCGKKLEQFKKLEDCSVMVKCSYCKGDTHKIISLSTPILFTGFFDESADMYFTGHGQKRKELRRAGLEERGIWTSEMIEERKWKRKEKKETLKKKRESRKRMELPTQATRRAEDYFEKRESGNAREV